MQQSNDIKEKLFQLVEKHCETIASEAKALSAFMRSNHSDFDLETLQKCHFLAHKLKGSSATMGFERTSHLAEQLEQKLKTYLESKRLPSIENYSLLQAINVALQETLSSISPDQSTLLDRFR